jgi:hypothetical protein
MDVHAEVEFVAVGASAGAPAATCGGESAGDATWWWERRGRGEQDTLEC